MQVTFKATVIRVYFFTSAVTRTTSQLLNNFKIVVPLFLISIVSLSSLCIFFLLTYTIEVLFFVSSLFFFFFYINISVITFYDNENEKHYCTLLVFLYSIFLAPLYLARKLKSAVYYTSLGKDCRLQGCWDDLVFVIREYRMMMGGLWDLKDVHNGMCVTPIRNMYGMRFQRPQPALSGL